MLIAFLFKSTSCVVFFPFFFLDRVHVGVSVCVLLSFGTGSYVHGLVL